MAPDPLQAEAEMLASRCSLERADYLFEVAHLAHRGPAEAEALQRLAGDLLASRDAVRPTSQTVGDFLT